MIIHCTSCGKSISSRTLACPYCYSEVNEITLEMNGIVDKENLNLKERVRELVLQFVHK